MVRIGDKPMMIYFVSKDDEIVYVGQTIMTLAQRKGKHWSEARKGRGSVLGAGIRKHGQDAYDFKKHSLHFNQKDADEAEKHYIKKYKPRYNVQEGGKKGYTPWNKGKKETRPDVLKRISEGAKNGNRPKRGKATQKQISSRIEAKKAKMRETANPFICHENGKTYWLKVDAAEDLKISPMGISAVLMPNHKMKSYKGYTFSYLD